MLLLKFITIFASKISISFQEMKKDKAAHNWAACVIYNRYVMTSDVSRTRCVL